MIGPFIDVILSFSRYELDQSLYISTNGLRQHLKLKGEVDNQNCVMSVVAISVALNHIYPPNSLCRFMFLIHNAFKLWITHSEALW